MAITTRAMEAESSGRSLISATGSYLSPATAGPIDIDVEVLKQGRSLSTLRAKVSRAGKDLAQMTGIFADRSRSAENGNLVLGSPPEVPPVEDCIAMEPATDAPLPPPFSGRVDVRIHPDDAGLLLGTQPVGPQMRGWFRLRNGEQLDAHAVVLAADAFPPAVFNSELSLGWTPTVELSVQVRNPAPSGWLACRYATRFVTDGMLEEDGDIWDESGNLVALSRQLALAPR